MVFRLLVLAFLLAAVKSTDSNDGKDNEAMTSNRDDIYEQLVDLQHRHVDWLFDHPDVTAVDVNYKTVRGEQTNQLSLVIWVKKKLPEGEVPEERRLPRNIEGLQTDIIEGEIEELTPPSTWLPEHPTSVPLTSTTDLPTSMPTTSTTDLPTSMLTTSTTDLPTSMPTTSTTDLPTSLPTTSTTSTTDLPTTTPTPTSTSILTPTSTTTPTPTSTSTPTQTPTPTPCPCRKPLTNLRGGHCLKIKNTKYQGTLGYFTKKGDNTGILSNCHVTGQEGTRITTPLKEQKMDYVATVTTSKYNELVDASHSTLCDRPPPSPELVNGKVVRGIVQAKIDDEVFFCGCASGCEGTRTIVSTDFCIPKKVMNRLCSNQRFRRCKQILFTPSCRGRDSGSLLINKNNTFATGLVTGKINFRTSHARRQYGVANHIQIVLKQLGVTLAMP